MRFSVAASDIGPIGNATVDIFPLTVFAGDNNTGKTTLAHVARAVFRCLAPVKCRVSELLTEADKNQIEQAIAAGGELQIPTWLIEKIAEHSITGLRADGLDERFRQRIAKALSANHLRQLRRAGSAQEPFIELVVVGNRLPGRLFGLFEHPNGWGALVGAGPLVVAAFRSSWCWLLGSLVASFSLGRIRG